MPFITTEEVKAKRNEIKAAFPGYKFSVRCEHHSTILVTILSGPLALTNSEDGYTQVNHLYIGQHYEDRPEVAKLLQDIVDIAGRGQRELVYDSDYGSVPNFYVNLHIGKWNRPYEVKAV